MESRSKIFTDLQLPRELECHIFRFFSLRDLPKTGLVSKDFQALSLEEKNRCYFKSIKIYLSSSYNSITAIFGEKNTDLNSDVTFNEAAQHYDAPSWDPVFKIIGVNRDELLEKLTSSMIADHYTVSENPMPGAVFPQIAFDDKNKDKGENFDFAESALKLMSQLVELGFVVELKDDLKEKLHLNVEPQHQYQP